MTVEGLLVGVDNLQNDKWECVYSPSKEMKGHKVFKRRKKFSDGDRYSIADWSGDYPDETDDGPLWVDLDEPLIVCSVLPDEVTSARSSRYSRMILWDEGKSTILNKGTFRFLKEELKMDVLFKQYRK